MWKRGDASGPVRACACESAGIVRGVKEVFRMIEILIFIGIAVVGFIVFYVVNVIAIAWVHHPEGIIKAWKNKRKEKRRK